MVSLSFRPLKRLFLAPWQHRWRRLLLGFMTALLCAVFLPAGLVRADFRGPKEQLHANSQQSRDLFEAGAYSEAIAQLQQAVELYQNNGDNLNQALALRNLAFVYQQLGRWSEARQTISRGLEVIDQLPAAERSPILARILDIQGHLYLSQGKALDALQAWQSATEIYDQLGDEDRRLRSILTQAQALQAMGHYRRAIVTLSDLTEALADQPDSEIKATGLQMLGEALRVAGDLEQAETALQTSLRMAQQLGLSQLIVTIQVSLGNTVEARGQLETAQQYYQQAVNQSAEPITTIQAQLSELAVLINTQQWQRAESLARQIQPSLEGLPSSQAVVYAKINLAESRLKISQRNARLEKVPRYLGAPHSTTVPSTYTRDNLDLVDLFIDRSIDSIKETPLAPDNGFERRTIPDASTYTRNNLNLVEQFLGGRSSATTVRGPATAIDADTYTRGNFSLVEQFLGENGSVPQTAPALEVPRQTPSANAQADIIQLLQLAQKDAKALGDLRSESYVLGSLGHLYEQAQQWQEAEVFTQKALLISQSLDAPEISYRWQWQLGRIFKANIPQSSSKNSQNPNYTKAVKAYGESVKTLQLLRSDLVSINPEVQAAFQTGVEPIHRELVSLLLADTTVPTENLEKARTVMESLQLAELDNFFREACLSANPVLIDQVDRQAAVVYPIILPDRLDIIVRLPGQALRHYSSAVSQSQLEATVLDLRQALVQKTSQRYLKLSQQVYDWLVQPLSTDLENSDVNTLVFVSDGVLRNVPMAALYDGQRYLMERYAIALTPGLQLLEPTPIKPQNLGVLAAGLTEARQGFPSLPNVAPEIAEVEAKLSAQRTLLNQDFTRDTFAKAIRTANAPVIHLATHGQFSSNFDETFILTWNDRLSVHQLRDLLLTTGLDQTTSSDVVELLVLSACETAIGDQQAALGLAGTAVRSGARSTLGSLWQVSDEATALLISRFYDELISGEVTKAEALRRAQLSILEIPRFRQHPFFWAPYVLVGNWL
ncbi:CHAT domain-containing protein [Leptolyngbyaceae cyanobacterium CCMR0082]|uniref:CHAT domain-containing protein n=1 Tax=Adonisia turfae CCMR0082 TaxID=2304604 RepID=A0A6M0SB57_9CYAN|nr:CHAT domain-containing protein [Adonisia turfae]NEZ64912.1 CHAT domain-containing protein [Adonisia turfae CCMR0082]